MESARRTVVWFVFSWVVGTARCVFMIPRGVCRHRPTCMSYAREVIMREPWWRMGLMIGRRLLSCHPFLPGLREETGVPEREWSSASE